MTKPDDHDGNTADNPLHGQPPAPTELKDSHPEGENPNASQHVDADPDWKKRPQQYPATKTGLLNTDVPDAKAR